MNDTLKNKRKVCAATVGGGTQVSHISNLQIFSTLLQ